MVITASRPEHARRASRIFGARINNPGARNSFRDRRDRSPAGNSTMISTFSASPRTQPTHTWPTSSWTEHTSGSCKPPDVSRRGRKTRLRSSQCCTRPRRRRYPRFRRLITRNKTTADETPTIALEAAGAADAAAPADPV